MKDARSLSCKNMDLPVLYCCHLWKMALPYCISFNYPYLVADQLPIMWLLDLILWNYNPLSHQGMFSEGILKNAVSNTYTQLKLSEGMEQAHCCKVQGISTCPSLICSALYAVKWHNDIKPQWNTWKLAVCPCFEESRPPGWCLVWYFCCWAETDRELIPVAFLR